MKIANNMVHPEEIESFIRLLGLWEGVIALSRPPRPPFGIETTGLLHYMTEPSFVSR